jgi:hypothetical protein
MHEMVPLGRTDILLKFSGRLQPCRRVSRLRREGDGGRGRRKGTAEVAIAVGTLVDDSGEKMSYACSCSSRMRGGALLAGTCNGQPWSWWRRFEAYWNGAISHDSDRAGAPPAEEGATCAQALLDRSFCCCRSRKCSSAADSAPSRSCQYWRPSTIGDRRAEPRNMTA